MDDSGKSTTSQKRHDILESRPIRNSDEKTWAVIRIAEPFEVANVDVTNFDAVKRAANLFLSHLLTDARTKARFDRHQSWLEQLDKANGEFQWLPITWGHQKDENTDPRNSFWVWPKSSDQPPLRRALVMIATTGEWKQEKFEMDDFRCSIRVVAHCISPNTAAKSTTLHFTTYSASLPAFDFTIFQNNRKRLQNRKDALRVSLNQGHHIGKDPSYSWGGSGSGTGVGIGSGNVDFRLFVRIKGAPWLNAPGKLQEDAAVHDYLFSMSDLDDESPILVERLLRATNAASGAVAKSSDERRVVRKDRASSLPFGQWVESRPWQRATTTDNLGLAPPAATAVPSAAGAMRTRSTTTPPIRFEVSTRDGPTYRQATAAAQPGPTDIRQTEVATASAELNASNLFDRIDKTGIAIDQYFKAVKLPLRLAVDAPIIPGSPDGLTVNAQVTLRGVGLDDHDADSANWLDARPKLQVSFAKGDLTSCLLDSTEKTPPKYLSIATDPRWSWHEFGHVLIAASTGELELPFVHSIGDALAAIIHDVDSTLAGNPQMRGITFPWVSLPRRHDRCADDGWCWSGGLHAPSRFWSNDTGGKLYKGYTTEQIMSSTLFFLYLSLGGDEVDNIDKRRIASDNTVKLILVSLALLGLNMHVDADSVQHFVGAMLDADLLLGTNAQAKIIEAFAARYKMPLES